MVRRKGPFLAKYAKSHQVRQALGGLRLTEELRWVTVLDGIRSIIELKVNPSKLRRFHDSRPNSQHSLFPPGALRLDPQPGVCSDDSLDDPSAGRGFELGLRPRVT